MLVVGYVLFLDLFIEAYLSSGMEVCRTINGLGEAVPEAIALLITFPMAVYFVIISVKTFLGAESNR